MSSFKGGVIFTIKMIIFLTLCSPFKKLDVLRYCCRSAADIIGFCVYKEVLEKETDIMIKNKWMQMDDKSGADDALNILCVEEEKLIFI